MKELIDNLKAIAAASFNKDAKDNFVYDVCTEAAKSLEEHASQIENMTLLLNAQKGELNNYKAERKGMLTILDCPTRFEHAKVLEVKKLLRSKL